MAQGPAQPLKFWQMEPPQAVGPRVGEMQFFTMRLPGTSAGPDGEPVPTTMVRLRIDHEHGRFYGVFSPSDLKAFAAWCEQEATLAESGIITAHEMPGNGRPPG